MKKLFLFLTFLLSYFSFAQEVYVDGYYRSNGTYVAPHYRTSPNSTVNDNYSTIGNTNPHTGKQGTLPRDGGITYIPPTYTSSSVDFHYLNLPVMRKSIPEVQLISTEEPAPKKTKKLFRGGKYFSNNNGSKNYVVKTLSR